MKKYKKYLILVIVFVIVVTVDLVTKYLLDGKYFPFLVNFISLNSVHNTGAAFSMLNNSTLFLTIFTSILFLLIIGYYIYNKNENTMFLISLSLVIGGAFGNLYDRILFGYVRDFIDLQFVNFAIFNIADSALTVGIICLGVYLIFFDSYFNDKNNKIEEKTNE